MEYSPYKNKFNGFNKYARQLGDGTRYPQYSLNIFKELNSLYISTCGKATSDSGIVPHRQ